MQKLWFVVKRKYNHLLVIEKDGFELHLCKCADSHVPPGSSAYFYVDDISTLYDQCEVYGIVHGDGHLVDLPWGMKEFYVADPDGNIIRFGQSSFGGF